MELPKEEEIKADEFDLDNEDQDGDDGEGKNKINWDAQLLSACKKGEY